MAKPGPVREEKKRGDFSSTVPPTDGGVVAGKKGKGTMGSVSQLLTLKFWGEGSARIFRPKGEKKKENVH